MGLEQASSSGLSYSAVMQEKSTGLTALPTIGSDMGLDPDYPSSQ